MNSPFLNTPGELRTMQIGDTACVRSGSGSCSWWSGGNELLTLMAKNYGGTNGLEIFQRNGYGAEMAASATLYLYWESIQGNIPSGSNSTSSVENVFWNPLTGCGGSPDPHGNCLVFNNNEYHNHAFWAPGYAEQVAVPAWDDAIHGWPFGIQTIQGALPCILGLGFANLTPGQVTNDPCYAGATAVNYVASSPQFNGDYGNFGSDMEDHPSPAGSGASTYEQSFGYDVTPIGGGANRPQFTQVSGPLWVATPSSNVDADDIFGYGGPGGYGQINRKAVATGATCGSHPLSDVSGPGSTITNTSSSSYQYCVARVNGECYAGASVGQIYVNCPGITYSSPVGCSGVATHGETPFGVGQDICVGNITNSADALYEFTLSTTDQYGAYRRVLSQETMWPRMVNGFENAWVTPDNSHILFRCEFCAYQSQEMWMAQNLPSPSEDSIARWAFVPLSVTVLPLAGLDVNNAIVEFGYQEDGAPQLIDCTTRKDACIATASTVTPGNQPFYFASENPAGAPCATGCTIAIPAISQRVLYYQVKYRAANNTVLAASLVGAVVVP